MPQIIPIQEQQNMLQLSELCHTTGEPIYLTKDGYGDMVVLSMDAYEAYEEFFNRMRIRNEVMEGIAQADRGELLDGETAMAKLREKYGKRV